MSLEDVRIESDPAVSSDTEERIWIETEGRPSTRAHALSTVGGETPHSAEMSHHWLTVTNSSGDVVLLNIETHAPCSPCPLLPAEEAARLKGIDVPRVHFEGPGRQIEGDEPDTSKWEPYLQDLLQELQSRISKRELGEMVALYTSAVHSTHAGVVASPADLFQAMAADRTLTSRNVILLQALLWRCGLHDLFHSVGDIVRQEEEKEKTRLLYLLAPDMSPRPGCKFVHFSVRTIRLGVDIDIQVENFRLRLAELLGVRGECVLVRGVLPGRSAWLTCLLPDSAHLALERAVTSREEVAGWLTGLGADHVSFQQSAPPFPERQTSRQGLPSRMSSIEEEAESGKPSPSSQSEQKDVPDPKEDESEEEAGSTSSEADEEREVLEARRRLQQLAGCGDWSGLDLALRELPDRILGCLGTLLLSSPVETTVLHVAVREGFSLLLRLALQQPGISVDARDRKGNTPLLMAVKSGNSALVTFLQTCTELKLVPDLKVGNLSKRTPLHEACRHGEPLVLMTLLEFAETCGVVLDLGAEDKRRCTPLHFAARDKDALKTLLDYADRHQLQVDLGAASESGQTPLHVAARQNLGAVKTLLQHAADKGEPVDLAAKAMYGVTPLHLACQRGGTKMLKAMLKYARSQDLYVDVNVQDMDGDTPMHIAVMEGNTEAVQLLKHFLLTQPKPLMDMQEALLAEAQTIVSDWIIKPVSSALGLLRFPWRSETPGQPDPEIVKKAPPEKGGPADGRKEGEGGGGGEGEDSKQQQQQQPPPPELFKKNRWGKTPMDIAAELTEWAKDPPEDRRLPRSIERKVWMTARRGDFL